MPKLDILGGERDGFEPRGTDFVDGGCFTCFREPREDGCLAGGRLAKPGAEDVAEVDVRGESGGEGAPGEGSADGMRGEDGGRGVFEGAEELGECQTWL